MIVSPKKKLYVFMWVIMVVLLFFILWLVLMLLLGPYRILSSLGIVTSLVAVIFIYIKSVLNFFELKVEGGHVYISQFGKAVVDAELKRIKFKSDVTKSTRKGYRRIIFEIDSCRVVVTNFEHDGFGELYSLLLKKGKL